MASFSSRLGLLLAALALLAQSLVLAAPMPARAADARTAQAQLAALFGPGVVVCTQSDDPAGPPPPDCRDSCPLCRLAADVAALDLPDPPAFSLPLRTAEAELAPLSPPLLRVAPTLLHPLPRGPPSKT